MQSNVDARRLFPMNNWTCIYCHVSEFESKCLQIAWGTSVPVQILDRSNEPVMFDWTGRVWHNQYPGWLEVETKIFADDQFLSLLLGIDLTTIMSWKTWKTLWLNSWIYLFLFLFFWMDEAKWEQMIWLVKGLCLLATFLSRRHEVSNNITAILCMVIDELASLLLSFPDCISTSSHFSRYPYWWIKV